MRCPYCAEEVKDEAVVCRHCQSELFVVKPLLEKIREMGARLATIEQTAGHAQADAKSHTHYGPARHQRRGLTLLEALTCTYITLVVAHFLIIVQIDANQFWLRLISIVAPFLFGVLCRESDNSNLVGEIFFAIAVSAAANFSMLAIVAHVDKVPFLPKDAVEWREFRYYSASIAFGFFAGVFIRNMLIAIYSPNSKPNKLIEWIARFLIEQFSDGKPRFTLKAVRSMVSSVLGFGSAVISIITGMWEFLK